MREASSARLRAVLVLRDSLWVSDWRRDGEGTGQTGPLLGPPATALGFRPTGGDGEKNMIIDRPLSPARDKEADTQDEIWILK